MDNGQSKVKLSPPTALPALCVSFFWGRMSQMMRQYVTLAPWGTSFLWMKKIVSYCGAPYALEMAAYLVGQALAPF